MDTPAPMSMETVLSPEWLSQALSASGASTRVSGVRVVETLKTQAHKIRFEVDYDEAPAGASAALCVKGFFDTDQLLPRLQKNCRCEVGYYRDIAPRVAVQAPTLRYSGIDEATGHGLILMDDVVAAGGRFLTALEAYSFDQAASTLDQLARLHAPFWGKTSDLDAVPWLGRRMEERATNPPMPIETLRGLMAGERSKPLRPEITDADRIQAGVAALAPVARQQPECLVHGDAHAGNLFELDGQPGLIDWQLLQRCSWALDVAYHLGAALSVEERRRSEQALLKHYLERLRAYGVEPPAWDVAWEAYRSHMVYGYYLWCITRLVAPPVILEFVRRLGTAVTDLESFELIGV